MMNLTAKEHTYQISFKGEEMELEERVKDLEDKVKNLEININKSLSDIKISLAEISASIKSSNNSGDLKNELIEKDVKANNENIQKVEGRVKELEDSNKWLVRLIIGSIIGLVLEAVAFYMKTKGA